MVDSWGQVGGARIMFLTDYLGVDRIRANLLEGGEKAEAVRCSAAQIYHPFYPAEPLRWTPPGRGLFTYELLTINWRPRARPFDG